MRRLAVLPVALLLTGLLAPSPVAAEGELSAPLGPVLAIAHRGASYDAPEHTFAAYDLAMQRDVDMLECDLQLTKDEVLVCVHDTTVDRTSDKSGRVDAFTLAELRQADFGSWFNDANPGRGKPEFVGQRIVPFEEQLSCYLGHNSRMRFHVETKAPAEYDGRMEPVLVDLLRRKGLLPTGPADPQTSPVIVQSFELASLEAVKRLAPSLPTAFLFAAPPDPQIAAARPPGYVDALAPVSAFLAAHPSYVSLAHEGGYEVHTWTVDDPDQMDLLLQLGVDGIFSNRPDLLRERIDARGTGTTKEARGNPAQLPPGCPGVAGTVGRPDPAAVSLAVNADRITAGNEPTLSGRVTDATGAAVADAEVTLAATAWGEEDARDVATVRTGTDGVFRARVQPSAQTSYVAHVHQLRSAPVLVRVAARLEVAATAGRPVQVTGSLLPLRPGARVGIGRRSADGTYEYLTQVTVDEQGRYVADLRLPRGRTVLVVYVSAYRGADRGARSLAVEVR